MKQSKILITAERLREILSYDPETGVFTWLVGRLRTRAAGVVTTPTGYRMIRINQCKYLAHRLAWLYVHGEWPPADIDHINSDRTDNRLANLRQATRTQNNGNMRKPTNNTSGYKGVSWHRRTRKWTAGIQANGQSKYLGQFDCPIEAHAAYIAAARMLFGEFARAA